MSNCIIPNWNLRHQRQEQTEAEEGINRSSHVLSLHNPSYIVPLSNNGVTELTWENGQPAMHGLGGIMSCPQICQDELEEETDSRLRRLGLPQICQDELEEETGSCLRRLGLPAASNKPTWDNTRDSLESIVHQATCHNQNMDLLQQEQINEANGSSSSMVASGKWGEKTGHTQMPPGPAGFLKKRLRSELFDQCGRYFSYTNFQEEHTEPSTCASASATFCRDNDHTTMMTWPPSPESPIRSVKTKTMDEDSACHGGSETKNGENDTKGETVRSQITRNSRAAAIHNQSERRRRDRINQKMKALQKLVPNASKTDKASMLDEVIVYLKQLQAQIHMMSARSMPQMMMPPGMQQQQQHLHMSQLLARMGMAGVGLGPMGMGMGMLDMNNMARTAPHPSLPSLIHPTTMTAAAAFAPPPFVVPPQAIPTRPPSQANTDATTNSSVPYNDPYYAFLVQSMNIDFYNKMAALFQQQANQSMQTSSTSPQSNLVKRK